ncbi:MAG: polysaccharide biosynthesis tyrosine autokinase [bacterium]
MDETKDRGGAVVTAWLFILWKHKWLVMTFAGLIIASTFVFTRRQTVIYEASTQIVIDLAAPRYLPQGGSEVVSLGLGNTWNTKEFYETQYRIIRSRMVAEKVVEKLGLDRDLAFLGIADIEDPQERAHALEKADAPTLLAGRVKVEPVAESQVVFIKVRDQDPPGPGCWRTRWPRPTSSRTWIARSRRPARPWSGSRSRPSSFRADALAANEALLAYKQEADILGASLADSQNLLGQELQDARKRLREARQATAALREQMQLVKRLSAAEAQSSVDAVLDNGLIQQLKAQLVGLENERDELLKKYLDKHPDVLTANRKIKRVQEALTVEVAGIKQSLQRKLDVAARAEQRLASEVESLEQDARAMHTKERRYQELSTAVDSKKELLAQVELRLKEAELQADSRANNVRIIDKALTPSVPVSPRLMLNLAVALLISLVGGFGLAFLVEQLDSTVKSQEQLERDFGLTFLGVIPRAAASIKNTDRYILENPTSTAAECVRTVRTNLLFMAPERELRTMLVTSAGPREGKTSTCVNIGATMAYAGSRVLLVDSDLRRPRLHRIFDMTNDRGLTNLILDASVNVADMVQPSGVEGMDVMCSGPLPPNPAELLQTKGFRRTLERLKDSYDRVIFDSPPVVAVTDAQVLGMQLDGALLVVRAGQTTREMLRKARRLLSDVNVHILGALLNSIDVTRRGYGQYYYRYYRQNAAYAEDQPSEVS